MACSSLSPPGGLARSEDVQVGLAKGLPDSSSV